MKGCALYKFFYPGKLRLLPGESFFTLNNQRFMVGLFPHAPAILSIQLGNPVIKSTKKYEFSLPSGLEDNQIVDYKIHDDGSLNIEHMWDGSETKTNFRRSESISYIQIAFESNNLGEISDKLAMEALSYFIDIYRYTASDITIKEPSQIDLFKLSFFADFHDWTENEKVHSLDKRIYSLIKDWKTKPKRIIRTPTKLERMHFDQKTPEKITGETAYFLQTGEFSSWMKVFSTAYELADSFENYNSSIIQAFIAYEMAMRNILKTKLSNYKVKQLSTSESLFNKVYSVFPQEISDEQKSSLNKVRKIRNKVIHDGKSISPEDSSFCLTAIHTFLWLFKDKLR